jgi:hypothetical protein
MELRLFNTHNPPISFFPCTLSSFSFQFSPVLDCHCARQHLRLACLTPIILIDLSLAKVLPPIFQVATLTEMSSRRSRSRQSGSSRITEEQISDLVSKLQDLLPEARLQSNARVCNSLPSFPLLMSWMLCPELISSSDDQLKRTTVELSFTLLLDTH